MTSNALMSKTLLAVARADDPKQGIIDALKGAVDKYEVMEDEILLGTYIEPEKTAGGIYRPQKHLDESRYQGKVGLLLKKGPSAWKYDRSGMYAYEGDVPEIHSWLVYRASEGWEISLNGVSCRIIKASQIRGVVTDPKLVW